MKRIKKSISIILIILAVVIIAMGAIAYREFRPVFSKKIKGNNSIYAIESVNIGEVKQCIQIRGDDKENPVLLWLHGGPGAAQMPVSSLNKELEQDFVVVHWDQRGAGKSNHTLFDENSMSVDRFVNDVNELTIYLKERLNKQKIYLLGHSWGTHIGLLAARDFSEHYYAYIGVSQIVYTDIRAHSISYEWLSQKVEGNKKDIKKLNQIGNPPYEEHGKYVSFAQLVSKYGGGMDISFGKMALTALFNAPEYKLSDFFRWVQGSSRGSGPMWEETLSWDALLQAPQISVPVYLFMGKNDYNTPLVLAEEYLEILNAPIKQLIKFEESAHTPFFKEPKKFYEELKKIKTQTL